MNAKRQQRDVHGILLLDKPQGISSNAALQRAKRLFSAGKAGHTGSLDPLATGLLPICFGEATKVAGYLLGARKAYLAECRLGVTTTTEDADGEIVATRPVPALDGTLLEAAMVPLRGRIQQIPPIYSALKQDGVPLYKRARRGEDVQAPTREVEIFGFDLLGHDGDTLRFRVECGSGTYVRSLIRDLGEALGCGAHLTLLRREWIEPFLAPRMITLDQLELILASDGITALDRLLLPIEQGLSGLPALLLDTDQASALGQGKKLSNINGEPDMLYRALNPRGELIALAELDAEGLLRVRRGFNVAQAELTP